VDDNYYRGTKLEFLLLRFLILVLLVTYSLLLYLYVSFDVPSFLIMTANYLIENIMFLYR
jgi:hypothetical protein